MTNKGGGDKEEMGGYVCIECRKMRDERDAALKRCLDLSDMLRSKILEVEGYKVEIKRMEKVKRLKKELKAREEEILKLKRWERKWHDAYIKADVLLKRRSNERAT